MSGLVPQGPHERKNLIDLPNFNIIPIFAASLFKSFERTSSSKRNQAGMTSKFPSSVAVGYRIKHEVLEPIFDEALGSATPDTILVERIIMWSYTTKERRALSQLFYPIQLDPETYRADLLVLCRLVNRSTPDEYAEELVESETDKKVQKYVIEQIGGGLQESDVTFDVVKNVPFRR